jgi:hypothetical protein
VKVTESWECKSHCLILYSELQRFNGNVPRDIGDVKELRYIFLDRCNLFSTLPDSMANLTKLNSLEIWRTFEDKTIFPKVLREMKSLPKLVLWNNDMAGGIPEWVCELTWLTALWYHLHFPNPCL